MAELVDSLSNFIVIISQHERAAALAGLLLLSLAILVIELRPKRDRKS